MLCSDLVHLGLTVIATDYLLYVNRKVTLSDVNPELFKLFLEFLYCGTVNMKSLSAEQIADLLVFSDQYEVHHSL